MLTIKEREEQAGLQEENVGTYTRARYYSSEEPEMNVVRPTANAKVSFSEPEIEVKRNRKFADAGFDMGEALQTPDLKTIEGLDANLLPSQATLRALNKNRIAPSLDYFEKEDKAVVSVTGKGKAIIAIYTVAIIALFLIVIFNAIAIMQLGSANIQLESANAQMTQQVSTLSNEISEINNTENLLQRANELGMVQGNEIVLNATVPSGGITETQVTSNWFDWLCDFFGGIFS